MSSSDDPANNDDDDNQQNNRSNEDPSSNEFRNLFHANDDDADDGSSNSNMQLEPEEGQEVPIGVNGAGGVGVVNYYGGVADVNWVAAVEEANNDGFDAEEVPPLPPPPIDGGAVEVVVIPNNIENNNLQQEPPQQQQQLREEAIVVEGEGVIGPQLQQQVEGAAPSESVQLWEEVAFGLEKNQTGKPPPPFVLVFNYLFRSGLCSERGECCLYLPPPSRNKCPAAPFALLNSIR